MNADTSKRKNKNPKNFPTSFCYLSITPQPIRENPRVFRAIRGKQFAV
jgi:hypothetical protein